MKQYFHGPRFTKCVEGIKEKFPLKKPVLIRTKCLRGLFGEYYYDEEQKLHVIVIERHQTVASAIDTFLHEYAHALDYQQDGDKHEYHDSKWGKHYARVYRDYHNRISPGEGEGDGESDGQTDSKTGNKTKRRRGRETTSCSTK